jgi:hypothetical protein
MLQKGRINTTLLIPEFARLMILRSPSQSAQCTHISPRWGARALPEQKRQKCCEFLVVSGRGRGKMAEAIPVGDGHILDPITSTEDFFILSRYKGPKIDSEKWCLEYRGSSR